MNLLEKAKVITTPTAYSEGKLHSVKPEIALGPELVTNGDFATDSDWLKQTGWTISGGTANCNGTINKSLFQTNVFTIGKKYKINFTISNVVGGLAARIWMATGPRIEVNSDGNYTTYWVADQLDLYITTLSTNTATYSIDNVSVKEDISADFDFTRNSSATRVGADGYIQDVQIIGGELVQNGDFEEIGSELVVNGSFATDSDWNKGTGWSISGGVSTANNVPNLQRLQNTGNAPSVIGSIYKYSIDVSNVSGFYSLYIYGVYALSTVNTEGTIEGYVTATSTNGAIFVAAASAGGLISATIDNVSVKEVGQNWTFATGWSMGDGKAVYNDVNTSKIYQNISLTQNNKYRIQFTISDASTYAQMWIANATGNIGYLGSGYVQYTNGTYVTDFVMPSNQTTLAVWSTTGGSSFKLDNVSVKEVTDDTNLPRINYENGIGHLLLEGQRTNLVTYSESFSNAYWTKTNATITANALTSPDGYANADSLIDNTTNAVHRINTGNINVTSANAYTLSFFVKKGYVNYVHVDFPSAEFGSKKAVFNIDNGTITSETTANSSKIESYVNGWYRCSITLTATSSGAFAKFYINPSTSSTVTSYIGTNSVSVYLWGAQIEQGTYPTSYIVSNSGSATTRIAETCNNAGNSNIIPSDEGVLYAEIAALANDGVGRAICLSDGTNSHRALLSYTPTTNELQAFHNNGVGIVNLFFVVSDVTNFHKLAFKYKLNDFALWIDGIEVATSFTGGVNIANTFNRLDFENASGTSDFYGKTRMVAVFPYLSNDELECLTGEGYGSFEAMALANNYTII
jgi:hypothetical protein